MWLLVKDFFTSRAVARKAARFVASLAAAMLVPPIPNDIDTWLIRLGVGLSVGGLITLGPKDKEKANG